MVARREISKKEAITGGARSVVKDNGREAAAVLALLSSPGVGSVTATQALTTAQRLGVEVSDLLGRPLAELSRLLPAGMERLASAMALCGPKVQAYAARQVAEVRGRGGDVLQIGCQEYPLAVSLALGRGAPPLLFTLGNLALLEDRQVGVVGTRRPTVRGAQCARACARFWCGLDAVVVSGGAVGVDWAAHTAALRWGGQSIVVLPEGILHYAVPRAFERALGEGRLLLLSEFQPYAPWRMHAAVTRNATISGLTELLCAVEPGETGGSLQTMRHSLGQSKPVFCRKRGGERGRLIAGDLVADLVERGGALRGDALLSAWESGPLLALPAQGTLL
jgi:DNA processing protein